MHYAARRLCQRDREICVSWFARDALDHSYSTENFRGTASRAVNIRIHKVPKINRLQLFLSRFSEPSKIESNLRVIVAIADYQGVRDLFMITVIYIAFHCQTQSNAPMPVSDCYLY